MKRILSFIVAAMFAGQTWAAATTFTVGNLRYTVTDETNHYVWVVRGSAEPTGVFSIQEKVTNPNDGLEYTVTSIGNDAFYRCSSLTSVTIPNSVTSIGDHAFCECSGLTSVTIGNSVTSIDNYAFSFCSSLTSVTIPNSVTIIDNNAFAYCSSLTTILIPESVTIIGEATFFGCVNLTDINVESDNTKYSSQDGVLFNKDKTTIVCYPAGRTETTYTTPESVTSIGNSAFSECKGLTSVTIGNSVKSIGNYAFGMCSGFTTLTIGSGVENIGTNAFKNCPIETLAYNSNYVGSIFRSTFPYADIKTINIGDAVTSIDDGTFQNCTHLTSLSIGSGVETIGTDAFKNCPIETLTYNSNIAGTKLDGLTTLKTVNIGDAVTTISNGAFRNSTGLTDINVSADNDNFCSIDGVVFSKDQKTLIRYPAGKTGSYTIPDGVTAIGKYAFYNCKNLTSVTIPNSVTSIGNYAFEGCSGLTSVTIGNSVTTIGADAFKNCNNLQYNEYDNAFYLGNDENQYLCLIKAKSTSSSSCDINNNCKVICSQAFINCNKLTTVTIGNSVTSIGDGAFGICSSLTSITIPESVISIGENAFMLCGGLTTVTIPHSVTSIGDAAFNLCSKATFYCECDETLKPTEWNASWYVFGGKAMWGCKVIRVAANNTEYGSLTMDGENYAVKDDDGSLWYLAETTNGTATLTAIPNNGYHVIWNNNSTENQISLSVTESKIYTATFEVHVEASDAAVAPTCTEAGKTEGKHCSVCNTVLVAQQDVDELGHTEVTDAAVAATCTTAGKTEGKHCSVCNAVLVAQQEVEALGHTEVTDAAIAATCTAAGKTEGKHCSVCNAVLVAQQEVDALGHKFEKYTYNNDATTAADGTETATCTRGCGATDTHTAAGTKLAETPEKGTAVAESAANAVTIYAHHNIIVIENATDEISIYNAMGTLIRRDATPCVRTEINVNAPGVYIVKVGGTAKRVMVN